MRTKERILKAVYLACVCGVVLSGCADRSGGTEGSRMAADGAGDEGNQGTGSGQPETNSQPETENVQSETNSQPETKTSQTETGSAAQKTGEQLQQEPRIVEEDWSDYFDGLNGTAVLYDPSEQIYAVYNREAAQTRRSPCSTFKIISSMAALEYGVIDTADSVRAWSGEWFWNEDWNRDIGFEDAFRTSCVWYFREVIDEIGRERMQAQLDALSYGNRDQSDWEGRLNTNNGNRALTGFWLESSLLISPMEQTEVMSRIFGEGSICSGDTQNTLKQVMLTPTEEGTCPVYGKTGMGMTDGITVDAWFTGFADREKGPVCFCVWLGRTEGRDVKSSDAKEIAIRLVTDYE